jgi:hypothetical protein
MMALTQEAKFDINVSTPIEFSNNHQIYSNREKFSLLELSQPENRRIRLPDEVIKSKNHHIWIIEMYC